MQIDGGTPPKPGGGGGGGSLPKNSYKTETKIRPDGLLTVTWTGQINGVNTPAYFLQQVLPDFPGEPTPSASGWVVDSDYANTTDGTLSKLDYQLTASRDQRHSSLHRRRRSDAWTATSTRAGRSRRAPPQGDDVRF